MYDDSLEPQFTPTESRFVIIVRRAAERHYKRVRDQEDWNTFAPHDPSDPLAGGFGPLQMFREGHLAPRAAPADPLEDCEIITYVREGTLGYEDSAGLTGLLKAGEFLRMTGTGTVRFSGANVSPKQWTRVFQIRLHPPASGGRPSHEQKRFSVADRRASLTVVASPDARLGSLLLHQDAVVYSMLLDPGQHLVHAFASGRGAWLHVVEGEAVVGDETLHTGDGAGFATERVLSLTATETTEILLVDLASPIPP